MLEEIKEVIALNKLVTELGERHSITFAIEPFLHRVLGHHIVNGDMFANVTNKVKERIVFHPVIIVDQLSFVRSIAVEIEELSELSLYAGLVML